MTDSLVPVEAELAGDANDDLPGSAVGHARLGWAVFPVHSALDGRCSCGSMACARAGKHPRTQHGLLEASTDPAHIRSWFARWPDANIAIATGSASGLVVLDVDLGHGGYESLEELERRHGRLPATVMALTGGGGRHLYFVHPRNGLLLRNRTRLGGLSGLDARGDGGYVVAPPSRHATGKRYAWDRSSRPSEIPLAPLPSWLTTLISERSPEPQIAPTPGRIREGERNNQLASLAGTMRRRGMGEAAITAALLQENLSSCDPPLAEGEVHGIAASIARYAPQHATVALQPPADDPRGPEATLMSSWREIEALASADPPQQLVAEILAAGDTGIIHGFTGTHKTNTALEMALSIERGRPFLGHFRTCQAHVGVFDEESDARRLGGRLTLIARGHDIEPGDDRLPVFAVGGGLRIDTDEGIERAFEMIGENALDVIFIDTLIRVHRLDENVAGDMAQLFTRLRELKRRVREELGRALTIVLIHHAPKPRMFGNAAETMARGSGDILGQVDVGLYLTKASSGQVLVTFSKNRWGPEGTKFLVNVDGGEEHLRLLYAGEAADALTKAERARTYVCDALGAAPDCELTRNQLQKGSIAAKVSTRTLDDALKAMKAADEVTTRKEGRETVYRLTGTGMTE